MSQAATRPRRGILVTGFGPFLDVFDNPSQRLALAVADPTADPPVHCLILPVSYDEAVTRTVQAARRLDVAAVVGLGVARGRPAVCVEGVAGRVLDPTLQDVRGVKRQDCCPPGQGPEQRLATAPLQAMATAMGAQISQDAGRYVCNAWLYGVLGELGHELPVTFVHVPPQGMDASQLRAGLRVALAPTPEVG